MTIGEGWDVGGLVNSKLSAMLPLPQQFSTNIRNRVKKNINTKFRKTKFDMGKKSSKLTLKALIQPKVKSFPI